LPQSVVKANSIIMEKMKIFYQDSLIAKIPPGGVFCAKIASCTITAYRSGKVLFQGIGAEGEANRWGEKTTSQTKPKVKQTNAKSASGAFSPPENIRTLSIIGSDEVGTGDYFGPITVVASYVDKKNIPLLKELGVKDSKSLSDSQISEIAKEIIHVIPYSLLVLHNEKYNQLQSSGMSQGKIKALLHNKALGNVLKKIEPITPDGLLIDQFAQPGVYFNYLKNETTIIRNQVFFSTKGEQVHLAVAAASIIARYAFVREFEKLSEAIGFTIPKGAGSHVDVAASELIKKYGIEHLNKYAKVHFANTEKALKLIK
jgi:ribonuclease HIII